MKSEFGTPAESRRASGVAWDVDFGNAVGMALERTSIKEGEVKEERERGILRSTCVHFAIYFRGPSSTTVHLLTHLGGHSELRSSLTSLNALSNDQSSKLDITYYSILEKLSFLRSSLASLKEVASATRRVNTDFQSESHELASESAEQIDAFSNFSSQETRIKDLAERVKTGRSTINSLGERVDVIRRKVEGYERAEGAWQEKTRKRLRVMWIVMSVVAAVMIGLVFFRYTPAKTFGPGVIHGFNGTELRIPGVDGTMGNDSVWSLKRETKKDGEGVLDRLKKTQGERVENDPRLRALDEL